MKVYIFYQTHTRNHEPLNSQVNVYAVTDKKELAKKFRETRNMKMFKEVVYKCDKHEFSEFMRRYGIFILLECRYKTQDHITGRPVYINTVATRAEDENVLIQGDRVFIELGRFTSDLSMLNSKYLKLLNKINYFNVYKMYGEDMMENEWFYQGVPPINEKLFRGIDVDQYAIFYKFSNNTLAI